MSRKRLPVWRTLLVMLSDLIAIGTGLIGAYWLRFHSPLVEFIPIRNGYDPAHYLEALPMAWIVWFLALRLENLYRRRSRVLDFNVIRRIIAGSCLALLILIALIFYQRLGADSRLVSVIMVPGVVIALLVNRTILHFVLRWMLVGRGAGQTRTAIVGTGRMAERIFATLNQHPEYGLRPVGLIRARAEGAEDEAGAARGLPVLGRVDALGPLIEAHRIDEVILAEPDLDRESLPEIMAQCDQALTEFRVVPRTVDLLLSGMTVETLDGIPMLGVRDTPLQGWNQALKRMVDVGVSAAGLLVASPLIAFLAWLVYRQDGGSPFYRQRRMGIDGRLFDIIKLRSMRLDAEAQSGPTFATDFDPRCTRLGAFLRRSHLDELPQLWNVFVGDMSLVGPRPERPYFVEQFRRDIPRYMVRHKVKSGITGWAQVNGLCGLHGSIDERLKYDLYYIEHWSLWLDLKILLMTLYGRIKPGSPA